MDHRLIPFATLLKQKGIDFEEITDQHLIARHEAVDDSHNFENITIYVDEKGVHASLQSTIVKSPIDSSDHPENVIELFHGNEIAFFK